MDPETTKAVCEVSENLFCVVWVSEMLARLYFHRLAYFLSGWNLMDFALVWLAIVDVWIMGLVNSSADLKSLSILRFACERSWLSTSSKRGHSVSAGRRAGSRKSKRLPIQRSWTPGPSPECGSLRG